MISQPTFRIISENEFGTVLENTASQQKSLHSKTAFRPGETICAFAAKERFNSPTYLTVQVSENEHITLKPELLQYINHSCRPNVFFDTERMELVCLKPIEAGQEFTFFYPSTEWDMAQPFVCQCAEANCLQLIRGASHLSDAVLNQYRLTEFILKKISGRPVPATIG